jgi:hypothetical protein
MFRHTDKVIRVKQLGLFYYTVDAAVRVNTKTEGGEGCAIKIHHKSATTSGTMELKHRKRVRWLSYKEEHI